MPMILGRLHGIRAARTTSFEVLVSLHLPSLVGRAIGCCSRLLKTLSGTGVQMEAFVNISLATAFSV
jgi:hypothetical protein